MRKSRRIAALALTAIVMGSVAGGAAQAQTGAEATSVAYSSRAQAEALRINLFGTDITASDATAEVSAPPTGAVTAKGFAGATLLGPVSSGEATAEQSGDGQQSVDAAGNDECPTKALEAVPGIGFVEATCPKASASVAGRATAAEGLGSELNLDVSVSQLLDTIQIRDPVSDGIDQVWENVLNPIVEPLTGNPVGDIVKETTNTLQDLLQDILHLNTTVRVSVAPVLAQASGEGAASQAYARAQAVRVEVLPVDELGPYDGLLPDDLLPGEPLLTVIVADAEASSSWDGGTATHDSRAAIVVIRVGTVALLEPLGLSDTEIRIDQPGQRICLLEGTPLESCIALAHAGTDADGAFAEGASIELLKGIEGGVNIQTGTVRTGAEGTPGELARGPEPVSELPRTGGSVLPLLGLGMLGLAIAGRRFGLGARES